MNDLSRDLSRRSTMRYIILTLVVILTTSIFIQGIAPVAAQTKQIEIPAQASEIAKGIFDLGKANVDGVSVRGILTVTYGQEFGHNANAPPNHGNNFVPGPGNGSSDCFTEILKGAVWTDAEPYVLDTSNLNAMSDSFVADTIATSLETWDSEVGFDIFGVRDIISAVDGADLIAPDGKNEILFGDIAFAGVIAFAVVWHTTDNPWKLRQILEYDIVFDDRDFNFGDADLTGGVMDLLNIAAHETGHALGLSHPADFFCTEETMFGSIALNETKKRSLNAGDIAGVNKLYG